MILLIMGRIFRKEFIDLTNFSTYPLAKPVQFSKKVVISICPLIDFFG